MATSPYSLILAPISLSFNQYSSFSHPSQENPTIFAPTYIYPNAFFYSSLPDYSSQQFNLVLTPVSSPQPQSNSARFPMNGSWGISQVNSFPSTNQIVTSKDNSLQVSQSSQMIKTQEQNCQGNNGLVLQSSEKQERRTKKKKNDRDYLPHRSEKKQVRKRLHQNQNRNVIPNQINQIISFLQKRTKSGALLERIWAKYPPTEQYFSINRFYVYMNVLKEKVGHYSNEASLKLLSQLYEPECRIWQQNEQRHYIKLSRLLISHFLREDSIFIILTSKRMKSQKKLEHLRARRKVACRVMQLFNKN